MKILPLSMWVEIRLCIHTPLGRKTSLRRRRSGPPYMNDVRLVSVPFECTGFGEENPRWHSLMKTESCNLPFASFFSWSLRFFSPCLVTCHHHRTGERAFVSPSKPICTSTSKASHGKFPDAGENMFRPFSAVKAYSSPGIRKRFKLDSKWKPLRSKHISSLSGLVINGA